jgi:cysteine desulfurase family protein
VIYLDYAATSWPKPLVCISAMEQFLAELGSNPYYSQHNRAKKGDNVIENARHDVAWVLGVDHPEHVIFTLNATEALNRAIYGFYSPGDRILASHLEHMSVTRPLANLAKAHRVKIEKIGDPSTGLITADDVHKACEGKPAKLLCVAHASNVTGMIQPVEEIIEAAHKHKCAVLLDTAQTAGVIPVKAEKWGVDFLAFSGHKHLLGPMGVGGFYVADPDRLKPVFVGSTGYQDSSDEMPKELPHRYEPGTPNAPGIAGLGASCRAIKEKGLKEIQKNNQELSRKVLKAFKEIPGVKIYGPTDPRKRVGNISFNVGKMKPADVGDCLDNRFEIMVRTGLCSSHWANETLGTCPDGVVRASLGYFTDEEDVDLLIEAVGMIAEDAPSPECCKK